MKPRKTAWIGISTVICLLLLTVTACKKTPAPDSSTISQASPALSAQELKQQSLAWNLKTLVVPYEHAGFTNPKWDKPAKLALTEFARARAGVLDTNEPCAEIISTNAAAAVAAGCNDPMVNYLYVRYSMSSTNSKGAFTTALCKVAQHMGSSTYPNIRKFYAAFRAISQYSWANNYPTNSPLEIRQIGNEMNSSFNAMLDDSTMPIGELYDASHTLLGMWEGNKTAYEGYYHCIEPHFFKNWPNAATSWLFKGESYYRMAWINRGGGYINNVTQEGWKLFNENLVIARSALEKAWQLNPKDPRIPTLMIKVDEAQQKSRSDMELWFNRAMILNPDNYDACKNKLHYLYPQWYGSRAEMIAFGKECVASTNWGGYVPIILVDAHVEYNEFSDKSNEEKQAYWKKPAVWPDIKAAYDRFFELNPNATDIYKNYAWYAYHAEQWKAFNELAPKVRPEDYDFFGGKGKFDTMVQLAKEHAGEPQ